MKWKDRYDNVKFQITTGDGRVYTPLWMNEGSEKTTEFNNSDFNFIDVYGTLVVRKKPKSGKFPLLFYFEGENNLIQSQNFDTSADDPRPWTVIHPSFGEVKGQPMTITRNESKLNSSFYTVDFWESIEADYPFVNFSIKDNSRDRHNAVYLAASESYTKNVEFGPADISKNQDSIKVIAGQAQKLQENDTYADFQNALNSGLKAIDKLLEDPLNAIQKIQLFLDLPSRYFRAVEGRLASYEGTYQRLKDSIETYTDKKYFESIGASTIASFCDASVNPLVGDYILISQIENVTNRLNVMYDDYQKTLDEKKVDIYNVNQNWNADATVQKELNSLVLYTKANLYRLSFQAKRERITYTNKNSNAILLAHKFIGLDDQDENLVNFIKGNNIKLNELFSVPKSRQIKYSV